MDAKEERERGEVEDESEEEEKDGKEGPTPKFGLAAGRQAAPFFGEKKILNFVSSFFSPARKRRRDLLLSLGRLPRQAGREAVRSIHSQTQNRAKPACAFFLSQQHASF